MLHYRILTLLLLLLLLPMTISTPARAAEADPADFLPSGVSILQSVRGDVDGDSREDQIALYAIQPTPSAQKRAGLLVLLATDDGVRPVNLFGVPPNDLRGEPVLDPNGSTDLHLSDLNADGITEILLSVTVQYQEPRPRTMLWVFGRGDVSPRPQDNNGPPAPPWAGTGFRLEAFLEGNNVMMMTPVPVNPDRTVALRREMQERRLSGPDPMVEVSETFFWRDGGYRLGMRSLTLPAETGTTARSPETAVLAFYNLVAAGDVLGANGLLGDDLRASRSATLTNDPSAPRSATRVEEVRSLDDGVSSRMRPDTERLVYVRVSMVDPRIDPPPLPSEGDENVTSPPPPRTTIAGTWRTQKIGEQWRLVSVTLHESANLDAISSMLPPGVSVVQTAGADLRGQGVEDLAVLAASPGRFSLLEPYVIFGGPTGPERSVPLASYVDGGYFGSVSGTIRADDVNADGKPEITLSTFVGAHSALLWVLQWNGATFVPLFAEGSNSPTVDLTDLDDDGIPEILLGQSGYCGSYAAGPHMTFAFRWENGVYRSASSRYPALHDGIDERAAGITAASPGSRPDSAVPCVQHMLSMAHAFRGRAEDARVAYRAYGQARQQVGDTAPLSTRPIYLAAEYVEADLRSLVDAATSGQNPGWGALERAVLHDLLGDALIERARRYQFQAEYTAERGKPEDAREARRKASEARQAATREYKAALDLDPADEEARRALGE